MSDSLITKKAIASSVKELMRKKDLQKISVADIVEHCGINRQTFYYHFKDKYDLVNWIYYSEVVMAVTHNRLHNDWSGVLLDVLNSMKREQVFYINALNVTGQNAFQDYFFDVTKSLLSEIIDEMEEDHIIAKEDKDFIAEFYAYGLVGITVQWARCGMRQPPEEIVQRLSHFINDSTRYATARYFKGETEKRQSENQENSL